MQDLDPVWIAERFADGREWVGRGAGQRLGFDPNERRGDRVGTCSHVEDPTGIIDIRRWFEPVPLQSKESKERNECRGASRRCWPSSTSDLVSGGWRPS